MDFILHYFTEIYLFAFLLFILYFVIITMRRNKSLFKKYDDSLEMSKNMLERQLKSIQTAEETNKILKEILAALKKK